MNYEKLSKVLSHALRHEPLKYGISLDKEGWAELKLLHDSIKKNNHEFNSVTIHDIKCAIGSSDKKRHEIKGEKIRALYGHSLDNRIGYEESVPPDFLFHGTGIRNLFEIKNSGLQKMSRNYVHLSENTTDALKIAQRRTRNTTIIKIKAKKAHLSGFKFYLVQNNIWLTDSVPPEYLIFEGKI